MIMRLSLETIQGPECPVGWTETKVTGLAFCQSAILSIMLMTFPCHGTLE